MADSSSIHGARQDFHGSGGLAWGVGSIALHDFHKVFVLYLFEEPVGQNGTSGSSSQY